MTQLPDPHGFSLDSLMDLLRSGAQHLIEQAVEAESSILLKADASDKTNDGRARLVRHCHLPERRSDYRYRRSAAGLSSTTISRRKADWWDAYDRWQRRYLDACRIVYIWADEWGRKEITGKTRHAQARYVRYGLWGRGGAVAAVWRATSEPRMK